MTQMKAALCRRYGGPEHVSVESVPVPDLSDGEILLRVESAAVNAADWRLRSLDVPKGFGPMVRLMMGWSGPRNPVLGFDAAGVVAAVAPGVTRVSVGDRVAVNSESRRGAHAQMMVVPAKAVVVPLPDALSFDTAAAAIFGGSTAQWFLDKAGAAGAETLLVNGASGTVGVAMVQLAKLRGLDVTAVCSAANADLLRGLGADHVVDYAQTAVTQIGGRFDLVADLVGNAPWPVAKTLLAPRGRYLMVVASSMWDLISAPLKGGQGRKVVGGTAVPTPQMLAELMRLAHDGQWRPVIDSTYPMEQALEAHARVESRRKVGSVLLHPQM